MKTFNRIVLTIFFIITCSSIVGQNSYYKAKSSKSYCFDYGCNVGWGQYRGEYQGFRSAVSSFDLKTGYGIFARYNFNSDYSTNNFHYWFDKRVSLKLGICKMKISSKKDDDKVNFEGDILELGLWAEINFFKYSSCLLYETNAHRFTPFVELAAVCFSHKGDNQTLNLKKNSYDYDMAFALGGGLKFAVFNGITLQGDMSLRFTSTDDIDYNSENSGKDMYYYGGISIVFNIGEIIKN